MSYREGGLVNEYVDTTRLLEEELGRTSVFKDEASLEFAYVPDSIPHRVEEFLDLTRLFKGVFSATPTAVQCVITGSVGTGKTMISKKFGADVEKAAAKRNINLQYIHINCRQFTSDYVVWSHLARELGISKTTGIPPDYLIDKVKRTLNRQDKILIVAMDELDYYIKSNKRTNVLYEFSRPLEDSRMGEKARLNLIAISRTEFFYMDLDAATQSSFKKYTIKLDRYGREALFDILKYRALLAFWENTISDECIELAAKIASQRGDARFGLELLLYAGKTADADRSPKLSFEHIRAAKAHALPIISAELLLDLDIHQIMALLAVSKTLQAREGMFTYASDAFESYQVFCEIYTIRPHTYQSFHNHLGRLKGFGCIDLEFTKRDDSKKGMSTKILLEDIPAKTLSEKLEKIIEERIRKEEE